MKTDSKETILLPEAGTLVVIDMLNDFIEEDGALAFPQGQEIVDGIVARAEEYRKAGKKVVFVCDNHDPADPEFEMFPVHCVAGTVGAAIVKPLTPKPGDKVITKDAYSAYNHEFIRATEDVFTSGVELCGVCTNICVLYTAADLRANKHGIDVYVDTSLVRSFDDGAHEWALNQMRDVLGVKLI